MTEPKNEAKLTCRCYINAKYYAKVAKSGKGTMRGYIPCPIHEDQPCKVNEKKK